MKGSKVLRKKEDRSGKTDNNPMDELIKNGWEKRATYDEPRLTEMVEMYEEIGLTVHLEPVDLLNKPRCSDCFKATPEKYKTIYTRSS